MTGSSEQDQKAWHRIEELFKLREALQEDQCQANAYPHTVRIDEVESRIYETLRPQVSGIIRGLCRVAWPDELEREVTHEAIHRLLNAYANFKGLSSLRTYCTAIIKNVTSAYLEKRSQEQKQFVHGEDVLTGASDRSALSDFIDAGRAAQPDPLTDSAERVLEELDMSQLGLTDKEFVAVLVKLASRCLMRKKLSDAELARRLGVGRSAFVDAYERGRVKICRHLKEKWGHAL